MNDFPFLDRVRDRASCVLGRARRVHSDEGGQSIVYIALILFLLGCFTFMVINSGALLHDKMQVQSAADASVLSGSTWVVRGMNLNSMMNIFMAMLLAEEIFMKSVFWTALTALLMSPVIEAFWLGVCLTTGTCNPAGEVIVDTFDLFPILWETGDDEEFLWDIMETLSDIEDGVHNTFAIVGELESVRVAMMNGAAFGAMYPPTIPEEEGELRDLCETTLEGSVGGYSEIENSLGGSIATALSSVSGFSYASQIRGLVQQATGSGNGPLWGELQIPYHVFFAQTAPYHFTNVMFPMAVSARYAVMCGGTMGAARMNFRIPAAWWCFFCSDNRIEIPNPAMYLGELFSFLDSGNPNVQPYLLSEDWESRRNYYGFAYKTPDDIRAKFMPEVFQNTYGDSVGMVVVAQAQIYNPHEAGGMFSPHWRTHLAPVSLGTETAQAAAGYLSGDPTGSGAGGIGGLVGNLLSLTGSGLDEIFAH